MQLRMKEHPLTAEQMDSCLMPFRSGTLPRWEKMVSLT